MLWLCLAFPRLPLEIFARASDRPRRQCVVAQDQRVFLCNPAAAAAGIGPGMSTTTACALGASLHVIERDLQREQTALAQLAQWAYRFTPGVSIKPSESLLLNIGPSLKLFGGLAPILEHVAQDLGTQGFGYRAGIAHTPGAAWLLARGREAAVQPGAGEPATAPPWFDHRQQAIVPAALYRALEALPLSLLDCPPGTLQRLQKPGFRTLGDLLQLPRAALGKRFGADFLRYLERVLGEAPDPQIAIEPDRQFRRELPFLDPVHRGETLLFPMQRLLDEFASFLQARQLDCSAFSWGLAQQDADTRHLNLQLSRPRHDKQTFMALTRTRLESCSLQAPVAALSLECTRFSQAEQLSGRLFDEDGERNQQSLEGLLDKLRARLQRGQVYTLACRDEHVPELAWQRRPPDAPGAGTVPTAPPNRPGWLLRRPAPIRSHGDELYWEGRLKLILGPERIETLWWRKPVKRDYFIARHEGGGLYWVFLDHQRERWYVHGIFS